MVSMNLQEKAPDLRPLELSGFPTGWRQYLEAVLGAPRREALSIIRRACESQFELISEPTTAVKISSPKGEVLFQGETGVEAVHIATPSRSLHIPGSSRLGERLAQYAAKALGEVNLRLKEQCVASAMSACSGHDVSKAVGCHYSIWSAAPGTSAYHYRYEQEGSIITREGVLSFSSVQSLAKAENDGMFGWRNSDTSGPTCFPHPRLQEDLARASFSNKRIEKMLGFLGGRLKNEEVNISASEVRAMLKWAEENSSRYRS